MGFNIVAPPVIFLGRLTFMDLCCVPHPTLLPTLISTIVSSAKLAPIHYPVGYEGVQRVIP